MRALRFEKLGSLDGLTVQEVPKPVPSPGEVLVRVHAAAVNPSDIKNVLSGMDSTTLPRIPGRDFSGIVVEGSDALTGKSVFGSGGNLGFGRDGSHAEFVAVPATAAAPMPANCSFEQAAAVGVAYMTAWAALIKAAQLRAGESVLILGTTGAVGSAAAWIARKRGARVLGVIRKASDLPAALRLPVDAWINLESTQLPTGARDATGGKGADVLLDVVGGPMFEHCLGSLARRGRQVAIASRPESVTFNLTHFYHNESRLFGVDSLKLSFEDAGEIFRELTPGFESGEYLPPEIQTFPLEQGPDVYRQLHESRIKAKAVLVP